MSTKTKEATAVTLKVTKRLGKASVVTLDGHWAKGEKDLELGRAKREASTLTTGSELKSDADMRGDRERGNRGTTSKGHAARENSNEK